MKHLPKATQKFFENWGKVGGKKRKKTLSPGQRSLIASKAAQARWGGKETTQPRLSIRLDNPSWNDPVYLEEILVEGNLEAWRQLYHRVADHPFGETADALAKVIGNVEIYGATNLWRGLLNNLRGGER